MKATYTKMRDGTWGVKVSAKYIEVPVGLKCTMEVVKKSGQSVDEQIQVIWIGKDNYSSGMVALCKIIGRTQQVSAGSGQRSSHVNELREELADMLGSHVEAWSDAKVLAYYKS